MKGNRGRRRVRVVAGDEPLVSSAGASLLIEAARATGADRELSRALRPWRRRRAEHDPGKVLLDVALAIALGGDCLADLGVVRAQPDLFGVVASDPTVSRLIDTLADDAEASVTAIRTARAAARAAAWSHRSPVSGDGPVIVDLDATIVLAHSEKEGATPTFKRTFGFHPLLAFVDHGTEGTGEPLAALLREGRSNANDAADQIAVLDAAIAQLPDAVRGRVLLRGDTGSGVQGLLHHVTGLGLNYSVGVYGRQPVLDALTATPRCAWRSAIDSDGNPRDGAQVAEITRYLPANRHRSGNWRTVLGSDRSDRRWNRARRRRRVDHHL